MPRISSTTVPEYSYDFPIPNNSSIAVHPQSSRKQSRRSQSPPHHNLHHIPHFPSHSSKYSPASRAAEISRLLDPTYSTHPQGSGSTSSSPLSVFVDHYGDLHDPDYRHFPVVAPRPKWERGDHDDDLAEEDEDAFDSKHSLRVANYRPSYVHTYRYDVPSASPSSYASLALHDDGEESPFADETEKKEAVRVAKKHRRHSKPVHDEKHGLPADSDGVDYHPSEYAQDDWTPTCTQAIRREWQAIVLRMRFTLFRTQRKIKRRLGTG